LFTEGVIGQLPDGRRFFCHTSGLLVADLARNGEPNGDPAEQQ
jgi:hypothetical protein